MREREEGARSRGISLQVRGSKLCVFGWLQPTYSSSGASNYGDFQSITLFSTSHSHRLHDHYY